MKLMWSTVVLGITFLLVGCGAFSLPDVPDNLTKEQRAAAIVSGGSKILFMTSYKFFKKVLEPIK